MKVWEVVRNFNKNFTDDFRTVYFHPDDYPSKTLEHIPIIKNGSNEQEHWKMDTKDIKKVN